jgi:hypothetical protein
MRSAGARQPRQNCVSNWVISKCGAKTSSSGKGRFDMDMVVDLEMQLKRERILARLMKRVTKRVATERKVGLQQAQSRTISIPIVGELTDKTRPEDFAAFAEMIK